MAAQGVLGHLPNVMLTPPADYPEFVWLMDQAQVIITDSGGVQEEAPSLGKPVLVTRDTTERPDAVETCAATLVGRCPQRLYDAASKLLSAVDDGSRRQASENPYGDGMAGERIARIITGRASIPRAA